MKRDMDKREAAINSYTLREHQLVLLDMLKNIDRICKKYDIKYMLFAGTALGAVRHGGFIPWDDDLDVVMMRPEYERFLSVAEKELDTDVYYLQCEFSEHWPMFFSKLRKNNTACIERTHPKDIKQHQGIYVDIFPCDNLADNILKRKLQFIASKLVIAKCLNARGYITKSLVKKLFILLAAPFPIKKLHEFVLNRQDADSAMVHSFFAASSKYKKSIFPRRWLTESVLIGFEDASFPVSSHYTELLTRLYGDYMTLPPAAQREKKVHGEIVDLHNSYEKYIELQRSMKFSVLTRSIR